jgi:hypothetical protein
MKIENRFAFTLHILTSTTKSIKPINQRFLKLFPQMNFFLRKKEALHEVGFKRQALFLSRVILRATRAGCDLEELS